MLNNINLYQSITCYSLNIYYMHMSVKSKKMGLFWCKNYLIHAQSDYFENEFFVSSVVAL